MVFQRFKTEQVLGPPRCFSDRGLKHSWRSDEERDMKRVCENYLVEDLVKSGISSSVSIWEQSRWSCYNTKRSAADTIPHSSLTFSFALFGVEQYRISKKNPSKCIFISSELLAIVSGFYTFWWEFLRLDYDTYRRLLVNSAVFRLWIWTFSQNNINALETVGFY